MTRTFLTIAGFTIATAGAVMASTNIDADGDGVFTYDEMLAAFPELTEETYVAVDANADGVVDADELAAAQDSGLLPQTDG